MSLRQERLENVIRVLENLSETQRENFDIERWSRCAIGMCTSDSYFNEIGITCVNVITSRHTFDFVAPILGITTEEAEFAFGSDADEDSTPNDVILKIRELLESDNG